MRHRLLFAVLLALVLASCSDDEGKSVTGDGADDTAEATADTTGGLPPVDDASAGPGPGAPDSDAEQPSPDTADAPSVDSGSGDSSDGTGSDGDAEPSAGDTTGLPPNDSTGSDAQDGGAPDSDTGPGTDAGDGGSAPGDAEPSADTGLEPIPDATEPEPLPEWLLSIDNGPMALQRVDIKTGATTDLCTITPPGIGPLFFSYPSLTFSRENKLFASRGGTTLDLIDPCTCEVIELGGYGVWSGVNGITSDKGEQLLGAAGTQDELISIATETGVGTLIGALGTNFTSHGATWSDDLGALYAINANDNALYTINPDTGLATFQATLSMNFGTVGIELLPANGVIYACSTAADLLTVDPDTGDVTVVGPMGQQGSCTNLAAPWANVPCIAP